MRHRFHQSSRRAFTNQRQDEVTRRNRDQRQGPRINEGELETLFAKIDAIRDERPCCSGASPLLCQTSTMSASSMKRMEGTHTCVAVDTKRRGILLLSPILSLRGDLFRAAYDRKWESWAHAPVKAEHGQDTSGCELRRLGHPGYLESDGALRKRVRPQCIL